MLLEDSSGRSKEIVRKGHLIERDEQLREPSVAEFVRGMERRRLTSQGWHSIYSVMRDGRQLAQALASAEDPSTIIKPYVQAVETGKVCEETGLVLSDIWRYFRHTWVTAYRSVPGRSMMVLVRDAACKHHPVIGIGALGSAVVQQSVRDRWIGWHAANGIPPLLDKPVPATARWLCKRLDDQLRTIYKADLFRSELLKPSDLRRPSERVIARLRTRAEKAMVAHRLNPQKAVHKRSLSDGAPTRGEWRARAESNLFLAKRCKLLASLLGIQLAFNEHLRNAKRKKQVALAFSQGKVRAAIGRLVRLLKADHVGINLMDITVCGAIAPYNALLGGKLVCLMLASPIVVEAYRKRYGKQQSLIASCMKGERVIRKPDLVLLGTTSLYGIGSSQYNRIRVDAEQLGGAPGARIEYVELGASVGFGSFHFSDETVELINVLLGRVKEGRRVNSIFGEGVNPLMRKIREALDLLGMGSDNILKHGNRRIVYAVPLATNFREILLGLQQRPKYIVPTKDPEAGTNALANYWTNRWLQKRIERPGILQQVATHTTDYPIHHGARVTLPDDEENIPPLLKNMDAAGLAAQQVPAV